MKCPACKADIDPDSLYCDQCGQELKICPKCHIFGKSKRCTQCGGILEKPTEKKPLSDASEMPAARPKEESKPKSPPPPPKQDQSSSSPPPPKAPQASTPADAQKTMRIQRDPVREPGAAPQLKFINRNIGADITFKSGDIIGRRDGQHTRVFGQYGQVSGRHAQVEYNPGKGWSITDLGSSNGTRYNNEYLRENIPQLIKDESYIIIANIEFYVRTE